MFYTPDQWVGYFLIQCAKLLKITHDHIVFSKKHLIFCVPGNKTFKN